jgi:tetratricopeptide (TPR) repeat protein
MLRLAIDKDPNAMPAYLALGNLYVAMNRLTQAREQFQTISARSKKPVAAMTMVAILLQAEGRTDEARRQYENALSVDSTAFVAANNLAWLLAQSGTDLDRALQLARQAQRQQPANASVSDTLGYVLLLRNHVDAAIVEFEKCVAAEPSNPVYRYHLGKADANAGRLDEARKHLNAALKANGSFDGAADARQLLESVGPTGR